MAQQGELSRVSDRMATAGANWRTAPPRPEPRTRACRVWTAHTCDDKTDSNVLYFLIYILSPHAVSVKQQTWGRSRVWSQSSGRGILAVSSRVSILRARRGRDLLASSADTTHKMSIGSPAARRVTDVEGGHCTTCKLCQQRKDVNRLFYLHL